MDNIIGGPVRSPEERIELIHEDEVLEIIYDKIQRQLIIEAVEKRYSISNPKKFFTSIIEILPLHDRDLLNISSKVVQEQFKVSVKEFGKGLTYDEQLNSYLKIIDMERKNTEAIRHIQRENGYRLSTLERVLNRDKSYLKRLGSISRSTTAHLEVLSQISDFSVPYFQQIMTGALETINGKLIENIKLHLENLNLLTKMDNQFERITNHHLHVTVPLNEDIAFLWGMYYARADSNTVIRGSNLDLFVIIWDILITYFDVENSSITARSIIPHNPKAEDLNLTKKLKVEMQNFGIEPSTNYFTTKGPKSTKNTSIVSELRRSSDGNTEVLHLLYLVNKVEFLSKITDIFNEKEKIEFMSAVFENKGSYNPNNSMKIAIGWKYFETADVLDDLINRLDIPAKLQARTQNITFTLKPNENKKQKKPANIVVERNNRDLIFYRLSRGNRVPFVFEELVINNISIENDQIGCFLNTIDIPSKLTNLSSASTQDVVIRGRWYNDFHLTITDLNPLQFRTNEVIEQINRDYREQDLVYLYLIQQLQNQLNRSIEIKDIIIRTKKHLITVRNIIVRLEEVGYLKTTTKSGSRLKLFEVSISGKSEIVKNLPRLQTSLEELVDDIEKPNISNSSMQILQLLYYRSPLTIDYLAMISDFSETYLYDIIRMELKMYNLIAIEDKKALTITNVGVEYINQYIQDFGYTVFLPKTKEKLLLEDAIEELHYNIQFLFLTKIPSGSDSIDLVFDEYKNTFSMIDYEDYGILAEHILKILSLVFEDICMILDLPMTEYKLIDQFSTLLETIKFPSVTSFTTPHYLEKWIRSIKSYQYLHPVNSEYISYLSATNDIILWLAELYKQRSNVVLVSETEANMIDDNMDTSERIISEIREVKSLQKQTMMQINIEVQVLKEIQYKLIEGLQKVMTTYFDKITNLAPRLVFVEFDRNTIRKQVFNVTIHCENCLEYMWEDEFLVNKDWWNKSKKVLSLFTGIAQAIIATAGVQTSNIEISNPNISSMYKKIKEINESGGDMLQLASITQDDEQKRLDFLLEKVPNYQTKFNKNSQHLWVCRNCSRLD